MIDQCAFGVDDLPPIGPAVITRVRRFDILARPPAQARRVGRFHLAGTPCALAQPNDKPNRSKLPTSLEDREIPPGLVANGEI